MSTIPPWVQDLLKQLVQRTEYLESEVLKLVKAQPEISGSYSGDVLTTRKVGLTMASVLDTDTPGTFTLALLDADQQAAVADSGKVPAWSSDNAAITVTAAADGMTATPAWTGTGTANISVSLSDTDGTVVNIPVFSFTVEPSEAVSGVISYTPAVSTTGTGTTTTTPTPTPTPTPVPTPAPTPANPTS
jgi:hypothetical protein